MGEPWRASKAWRIVEEAEAALNEPLAHLLIGASDKELARTREAQLAVFLQSLMAWDTIQSYFESQPPVAFAGHSLGQVTALVASGSLTLADGARLAAVRAQATQDAADATPGRLVALLGASAEMAEAACAPVAGAWVANDNAPGQVVIGGTPEALDAATEAARGLGARRAIPLAVGGAFHTPLMAPAAAALEPALGATRFAAPAAPVLSNVDGEAYGGPDGWPERLAAQLVSPVRWRACQLTLVEMGAGSFVEVGPGRVLDGLARRTVPQCNVFHVSEPADAASLLDLAPMEVA